jgi:hypothetical protein
LKVHLLSSLGISVYELKPSVLGFYLDIRWLFDTTRKTKKDPKRKEKYFVFVHPAVAYEIDEGRNLATLFPASRRITHKKNITSNFNLSISFLIHIAS